MYVKESMQRFDGKMIKIKKCSNIFRQLNVTYIYGPPGVGKTRSIVDKYGEKLFRINFYNSKSFIGYDNQDVILLDEFESSFKIEDMLNILKGCSVNLPCKVDLKATVYTKVYIISNIPLSEQYLEIQKEKPEMYKKFLRNIHNIIRFDEYGKHVEKQSGDITNCCF